MKTTQLELLKGIIVFVQFNLFCFFFWINKRNNAHNGKNGASNMTHTHILSYIQKLCHQRRRWVSNCIFLCSPWNLSTENMISVSMTNDIFFSVPVITRWYELNDVVLFFSVHKKMHNDYYEWFAKKKNRFLLLFLKPNLMFASFDDD